MADIETSVEIFCEVYVFSVVELVLCLAQASPVYVVVIIYGLVLMFCEEEFDVILHHDC